ncbi:MAG: segregation/condensation protein A [Candidatus Nanopelagicales bacterium]
MTQAPDVIDLSDKGVDDGGALQGLGSGTPDATSGFEVSLEEYAGPFDVLLGLIAKHKLEVTELALHQVTDDFCGYIREQGSDWDLEEATSFLVVAATLLDLKAARLLPSGEVEDEDDLALLEAGDLLFARLLQYRAFKEVSAIFEQQMISQAGRLPRAAGMDPEFADLLPDVVLSIGPERLAALAADALAPKEDPLVNVDHIHSPLISVAEQTTLVGDRLRRSGSATFRSLVSDAESLPVVIARFLSLLELFRQGRVALEQAAALGDLHIRWIELDDDVDQIIIDSEFDDSGQPVVAKVGASAPSPETEMQAENG